MPNNIESFVETLKSEGVDAGNRAAEQIKAQAQEQADQILTEARAEAERIVAAANTEAKTIQERMRSSLELATRDAIIALKETLTRLLNALLQHQVSETLSDDKTLGAVLREVIPAYTSANARGGQEATVGISKEMQSRFVNEAIRELTNALKNKDIQLQVRQSLDKSGFDYKFEGTTVEVNAESVTAMLAEMIDPELRKILESVRTN